MRETHSELKMTLCVDCNHHIRVNDGPRTGVWYNQLCGAISKEGATDPVTGERKYRHINSLGRAVLTDEQHPYCRDVNTGADCPFFAPKRKD